MPKPSLHAALAALALAALPLTPAAAQSNKPIKIGMIEDNTGPLQAYTKQIINGFNIGPRIRDEGHQHRRRPQDRDHR